MRYSRFDNSSMFFLLIYLSIHLPYVLGHGFVHSVVVGGQSYPGWNPFSDAYDANVPPRIVRKVLNDGFVASTDADIACHHGGNEGTSAIANAPAGSKVTFNWAYWPGDHQGPVSTYMTSCGGECSKFAANNAQWFKIDAEGYDTTKRQWAAAKLISDGGSWTSTIPAGLMPGEYLVRNEMYAYYKLVQGLTALTPKSSIALHSSIPQFYPSCSQVKVTGSGTHLPSNGDMVSMQLLYQGVTFPNIYTESTISFTVPGPPPVNFDGNGGGASSPSTRVTSTTAAYGNVTTKTSQSLSSSTSVSIGSSRPSVHCQLGSKLRRRTTF